MKATSGHGDVLTEKEAHAIALVYQGFDSKEIGRILSIAPKTADQRIDGARKKLGGGTRFQAARRYAAEAPIPDRFLQVPFPLAPSPPPASLPSAPQDRLLLQDAVFDDRASWDRGSLWRRPEFAPRDLGKAGRVLAILAAAVLILLVGGEAIRFATSLGMLFPT